MAFRRRARPEHELRTRDDTYPGDPRGRTGVGGSTALSLTSYSVDDGSNTEHPNLAPDEPAMPTELRVRYPEAEQFKSRRQQLARNLVIAAGAPRNVQAAYNRLRTQIIQCLQETGWNTVAITSPSSGTGNTLTAINLAISIARGSNHTVFLVELNLVNPSFREVLGFEQRQGIVDHLLYDVPLSEILWNPGIDRLVVIPAGSPVADSSELLASPKMARLVEELKRPDQHRIVLFDLAPVLVVDDAMAFSPLVDCALLVVEEGETRVSEVRRALDYLRSTRLLGVVLNRSSHVENDGLI